MQVYYIEKSQSGQSAKSQTLIMTLLEYLDINYRGKICTFYQTKNLSAITNYAYLSVIF